MSDNPDRNMKNEKFCSQLSIKDARYLGAKEDFHAVLKGAGETEITQENIQDWIELEVDPGFQLLVFL
jgi:hypothetical protein